MPRYEVRLEAQDGSGHFRVTRLMAEDEKAAQKACERKELELVLYQLSDADKAEILEATGAKTLAGVPKAAKLDASDKEKAPFRALDPAHRARLAAHRQEEPFKVVSVTEVPDRGGK